jgi:hypothetical protein
MNINQYITSKRTIFSAVVLAVIVLSVLPFARFISEKPLIIGEKPYYDLRITETIISKGILFGDNLVLDGREYITKPYHLMLLPFVYFFGSNISLILIISLFCGLISVLLIFLILKKLNVEMPKIFFSLVILILSPTFIFAFSTLNEFCFSIVFLLSGIYFFLKSENIFLPLFFLLLSSFLSIISLIAALLLLIFLTKIFSERKKNLHKLFIILFFTALIYYIPHFFETGFFSKLDIIGRNDFRVLISDLGSQTGMGIFCFVLGIIGLFTSWNDKKDLKPIYLLILLLLIDCFYFEYANIYLIFLFSIFAGTALTRLIRIKWEFEFLKEFTILLLIFGLLFSTISYTNRSSYAEPDKDMKKALDWLEDRPGNMIVFSTYNNGFWIQYWANKPVLTDGLFNFNNAKQKFEDSEQIFHSRDIEKTKELMSKYNIQYIFIDPKMKEGSVWNKKEGLWYLLGNNATFKSIYQRNDIEIWEYTLLGDIT